MQLSNHSMITKHIYLSKTITTCTFSSNLMPKLSSSTPTSATASVNITCMAHHSDVTIVQFLNLISVTDLRNIYSHTHTVRLLIVHFYNFCVSHAHLCALQQQSSRLHSNSLYKQCGNKCFPAFPVTFH